jgi:hypothetical protein
MTLQNDPDSPQDLAIARRLARLGAMPVDISRLDKSLRAQLPAPEAIGAHWVRRTLAIAASLLLLATILIGLLQERPVEASPTAITQLHEDLLAGKGGDFRSIAEANAVIAGRYPSFPKLPQMPADCGMAACGMKQLQGKNVACLLLKAPDGPVTVVVAPRRAVCCGPNCRCMEVRGRSYHFERVGDLTVVMATQQDRWISLVGRQSADQLIKLLNELKF